MRMYKVKNDGNLEIVVANINKVAGRIETRYQVSTAITRDENGNPVDIAVSVTCPTGQHADITDEEKAKYGQVDAWEAAAKIATEHVKRMFPGANVHMTESRPFGGPSNREEYRTSPETVTVPSAGGIERLRQIKKEREEKRAPAGETGLDTKKEDTGDIGVTI